MKTIEYLGNDRPRSPIRNIVRRIPGARYSRWLVGHIHRRLKNEVRMITYAVRNGYVQALVRRSLPMHVRSHQAVVDWKTRLPLITRYEDLLSWMDSRGIQYIKGTFVIYLPPQQGLSDVLGDWIHLYPPNAGFKLHKDIGTPYKARYVPARRVAWLAEKFVGTPFDQVSVANYLYHKGLGPRLYDLVTLDANGTKLTAFVVEHINGGQPAKDDYDLFKQQLEDVTRSNELKLMCDIEPAGAPLVDFAPPDCGGNLVKAEDTTYSKALYVDFQNFSLNKPEQIVKRYVLDAQADLRFGRPFVFRRGCDVYQSVPSVTRWGRRNTQQRWQMIMRLMNESGVDFEGRLVLDIGCNGGMMIAQALTSGASWCLGWDLPHVAKHAKNLLSSLGYTRFDIAGAQLTSSSSLKPDIPVHLLPYLNNSIVFYLSVHEYFGFISELADLPWRVLVYEGHEYETLDTLKEDLKPLAALCAYQIAATGVISDGDSSARPLAVLVRQGPKAVKSPNNNDGL